MGGRSRCRSRCSELGTGCQHGGEGVDDGGLSQGARHPEPCICPPPNPFQRSLARSKTAPIELVVEDNTLSALSTPVLASAASSASASHHGQLHSDQSPPHRAGSLSKELFEAQGDVVTAQAQVHALQGALRKVRSGHAPRQLPAAVSHVGNALPVQAVSVHSVPDPAVPVLFSSLPGA